MSKIIQYFFIKTTIKTILVTILQVLIKKYKKTSFVILHFKKSCGAVCSTAFLNRYISTIQSFGASTSPN
jgi:hypothetical protein